MKLADAVEKVGQKKKKVYNEYDSDYERDPSDDDGDDSDDEDYK